jgi:hypothetical protein
VTFLLATAAAIYALGMALVFGGTAALSFAAAPQTFRNLKPVDAGRVFGRVLRVFDGMALVGSAAAVVAAVAALLPEVTAPRISRLLLAASVHLVVQVVRRGIAPRMAALKPPETEDEERRWDPENRRLFDALHRRYVRLYGANLFLSAAALVVHALGG